MDANTCIIVPYFNQSLAAIFHRYCAREKNRAITSSHSTIAV